MGLFKRFCILATLFITSGAAFAQSDTMYDRFSTGGNFVITPNSGISVEEMALRSGTPFVVILPDPTFRGDFGSFAIFTSGQNGGVEIIYFDDGEITASFSNFGSNPNGGEYQVPAHYDSAVGGFVAEFPGSSGGVSRSYYIPNL